MKKSTIILIIFLIALVFFVGIFSTARVYGFNGALNGGLAWNIGGVELYPSFGFFVCPGVYNFKNNTLWVNPLSKFFPDLVTDC